MSLVRALLLALVFVEGGCAVSSAGISPSEVAFNQCTSDADCQGGDGTCNFNVCQGQGGTLTALLLAVTPPSTLVGVNSSTYFVDRTSGGTLGPGGSGLDLKLQPALALKGAVSIDIPDPDCKPLWNDGSKDGLPTLTDGSIPAVVTFTPSWGEVGVPVDSFSAKSTLGQADDGTPSYQYQQTVPVGQYDVYVKPAYPMLPAADAKCQSPSQIAPRLFLHETITSTFNFALTAFSTLNVNVIWPLAKAYVAGAENTDRALEDPLSGWTLDLIDQTTGRVLSTAQAVSNSLTPPTPGDTSVTYTSIPLVYAHASAPVKGVLTPVAPGTELLRLTPPTTDPRFSTSSVPYTAPTILAQLDGALVDSDGKPANAQIVQSTSLPTPVTVQFQTALADDGSPTGGSPMAAGVLVTAESIDGVTGLSTSFSRSIQVGADGTGSVDLLPGRYRVLASPAGGGCNAGSCLALVQTEWLVSATPPSQAGKIIEFSPAMTYSGSAIVGGTGHAAAGATVHATSSVLTADQNVLNVGDAATAVSPRATSGLVEGDSSFNFEADTGTFDVRVEPDPSTGYSWAVMPGVSLPSQQDALNDLQLDWPIIYRGKVLLESDSGGLVPIPKALIRAYAFLDSNGNLSTSATDGSVAIQVAETYSDDSNGDAGTYRLLVPKALAMP